LKNDIGEQNNIAKLFPEDVKLLDTLRKKWDSELINPIFESLKSGKKSKSIEDKKG
jgi:hypothetical protein